MTATVSGGRRTSITKNEEISYPAKIHSLLTINPPQQRQRWGDTQVLPHVNWGDLFFDLFYVAAAYNLSGIITESPDKDGILYYLGCFGPIMSVWVQKMYFDARFALDDDPFHRLFEILLLCFLGTCVLHISTVEDLSHPSKSPDMFAFSLGLTLTSAGTVARYVEVYLSVVGEEAAKVNAKRDIFSNGSQGLFYLAAAIYSGMEFYSGSSSSSSGDKEHAVAEASLAYESDHDYGRFRILAADTSSFSSDDYEVSHIPIALCLSGYLFGNVFLMGYMLIYFPNDGSHKSVMVPMNVDFSIHRYGEWTMLLLGESILSLLIVDMSNSLEYYVTFYAGIVSTVLLQYLHFRSQPHHADDHAMRRSKVAGIFFTTMYHVYSFALVLIGVSFKMLLYEYAYMAKEDDDEGGAHRRTRRVLRAAHTTVMRYLAGGGGTMEAMSTEDRQQRVANIFCGSMAVAWLSLDLLILSHLGYEKNAERCHCQHTKGLDPRAILFGLFRVGLIVFIATLSQYVNDPMEIALIGLAGIVMQVITRVLGDWVVPTSVGDAAAAESGVDDHGEPIKKIAEGTGPEEDSEEGHWPNMTHAVSKPPVGEAEDIAGVVVQ